MEDDAPSNAAQSASGGRSTDQETPPSQSSSPWSRRSDPLLLAVVGGLVTLLVNIAGGIYSNHANLVEEKIKADDDRALEEQKARYNLVLQAMATNDTGIAKRNIHFFIDAGLLLDKDCKIRDAIDRDNPVLPSLSGVAPLTPGALHSAPEIATAYNFPAGYDGRGVMIGLIELGGAVDLDDLKKYFGELKLPVPNVTTVLVEDTKAKSDQSMDAEVMKDVEIVGALAPAANIRVYLASFEGYARAIARATDDGVAVLQTGWGQPEPGWKAEELKELDAALEAAAEKNITVVAAVGNNGVTDGVADKGRHVDYPGSSPWVLSVGGTALKTDGGKIVSETVWKTVDILTASTGGGFSEKFPRPSWQPRSLFPQGVDASSGRGVPDVVASADPYLGTPIIVHGEAFPVGGTGVAVNIWAGLIARIDQALGYNVGYVTPRLYQEIGPARLLHTITAGDNSVTDAKGYPAGSQWSPVAGWGSPDGAKLLKWLREHPDPRLPGSVAVQQCESQPN